MICDQNLDSSLDYLLPMCKNTVQNDIYIYIYMKLFIYLYIISIYVFMYINIYKTDAEYLKRAKKNKKGGRANKFFLKGPISSASIF